MNKFFTKALVIALLLPLVIFANSRLLLDANGDIREMNQKEAIVLNKLQGGLLNSAHVTPFSLNKTMNTIDTLNFGGGWNVNFGFDPQDVMLQFFQAPADLYVSAVSFTTSSGAEFPVEVKIVKVDWTMDELLAAGTAHWGYYEATGNGYHDASPFKDNLDVTGVWVDKSGTGAAEPFGVDLWSDAGFGFPITSIEEKTKYWVNMMTGLGYRPDIKSGEIFGVIVKHTTTDMGATERNSLYAKAAGGGIYGWKYYANQRSAPGDHGWWSRDAYVWNVTAAVELYGDRAPVIENVTHLTTTIITDPREVTATITDDNPSGGAAGVAAATLYYIVDGGATQEIAMTNTTGDVYSGTLPGQSVPGTVVEYWVGAVDVEGLETLVLPVTYSIFEPIEPILFVYDDDSWPSNYYSYYYWVGVNDSIFAHDIWDASYGPLSKGLLDNYQIVYHVMGGGPVNQPADIGAIYKSWLDEATVEMPYRLFISGQDYGYISGYADTTFAAGTFEYDYLGIETLGPQDINYDEAVGAPSYQSPYGVTAVTDNILTGHIADYAADSSLFLFYDPYNEIGFNNWIDNLTPAAGAVVDLTDPNQADAAVAIHNEGATFKTVFWTVDPVCLNMFEADTSSSYKWVITDVGNPLVKAMDWFGPPIVSIERIGENIPQAFTLKQNYPNPFNPTTTINFSIAKTANVELTVYDVTGRIVATLVDGNVKAGSYELEFNGANFASGVYVYTLKTGNSVIARKMTLIK